MGVVRVGGCGECKGGGVEIIVVVRWGSVKNF